MSFVPVIPAKAQLTGTVQWSNGVPFDGYLLLGVVMPQNSDGLWPTSSMLGIFPPVGIPVWTVVPINAGQFDQNTFVFYNSSLEPPNTQYVAYWYDLNKRRLFPATGTPPTPFTISTTPFAPSLPSLTIPSTQSATLPTPQDNPQGGV